MFLLIFLIIFSCLFYGGVPAIPLIIIEFGVGLMVLCWLLEMLSKKTVTFVKTGLSLPLILFLGLIILQMIPLPLGLLKLISDNTSRLYLNFMSGTTARAFFTLSIYPYATFLELIKFLAYLGIFLFVVNKIETKEQFDLLINTIIFLGLFISIFGIIQKYICLSTRPFGPFAERSNFAGYINMIIPLAIGYFLYDVARAKRIIYGFSIVIMSLALFLSSSKVGALVYLTVLLFLLLFSRLKVGLEKRSLPVLFWFIFACFLIILLGNAKIILGKIDTLLKDDIFLILGHGYSWLDTLKIWQDFRIFGTGLGTFGSISSVYKTSTSQALFHYAHNDYLQLLCEMGLAGFISVALFFILYFNAVLKMWFSRRNPYVVCLVLSGIASLLGMLMHSFFDFNLHLPAHALLFFVILGLVYRLTFTGFRNALPK